MYCKNCGSKLEEGRNRFCGKCGTKVPEIQPKQSDIIVLKCPSCSGTMEIQGYSDKVFCRYCGTQMILRESETIKMQRLKGNIEIDKINANADALNKNDWYYKWLFIFAGVIVIAGTFAMIFT